jgi:hypothetical protein
MLKFKDGIFIHTQSASWQPKKRQAHCMDQDE